MKIQLPLAPYSGHPNILFLFFIFLDAMSTWMYMAYTPQTSTPHTYCNPSPHRKMKSVFPIKYNNGQASLSRFPCLTSPHQLWYNILLNCKCVLWDTSKSSFSLLSLHISLNQLSTNTQSADSVESVFCPTFTFL